MISRFLSFLSLTHSIILFFFSSFFVCSYRFYQNLIKVVNNIKKKKENYGKILVNRSHKYTRKNKISISYSKNRPIDCGQNCNNQLFNFLYLFIIYIRFCNPIIKPMIVILMHHFIPLLIFFIMQVLLKKMNINFNGIIYTSIIIDNQFHTFFFVFNYCC